MINQIIAKGFILMLITFLLPCVFLFAGSKLSMKKSGDSRIEVLLDNSEPVAALQFTVNASSSISIGDFFKGERIATNEWMIDYHRVNDSTVNVVILRTTQFSLPANSGSIAEFLIQVNTHQQTHHLSFTRVVVASPTAQSIDVVYEALELHQPSLAHNEALGQNYPNPFNPSTNIPFQLQSDGKINLAVYDITGRKVRTIVDEVRPQGSYIATWDSRNEQGGLVPTGIYFVRLEAGKNIQTRRMILLK